MLKKAGYVQTRHRVIRDCDDRENSIIEVVIHGTMFGVRVPEVYQAMAGIRAGRIEPIRTTNEQYLCGTAGTVFSSASGRAINITLNNGDCFTVSVQSLRKVIAQSIRYAPLYVIPRHAPGGVQTVLAGEPDCSRASGMC